MGNHRRKTCQFCKHQFAVGRIDAHEALCSTRSTEERERAWRQIESQRRWAANNRKPHKTAAAQAAPSDDAYGDLAKQVRLLYPHGIPTDDVGQIERTIRWLFTTFSMLRHRENA